jgi:hypothetical protein
MISRVTTTAILLLLALYAFWGNALGAGRINPFGILFVFFAAVTWLKWEIIRDAFSAAKGESQLPIIRLSAKMIGGIQTLRHAPLRRRSPTD